MIRQHRFPRWFVRHLREPNDAGKAVLALGLAFLTILATVLATLQSNAAIASGAAQREADRLRADGEGREVAALLHQAADFGAYRRWSEQSYRGDNARDRAELDPDGPDAERYHALESLEFDLAAWIRTQSQLLQEPYWAEEDYNADFGAYFADTFTRDSVRWRAEAADAARAGTAWQEKGRTYITLLTVTAVGLFFIGLASTMQGVARLFLAAAGGIAGVTVVVAAIGVAAVPVYRVPAAAIEATVRSAMELASVPPTIDASPLSEKQHAGYRAAVAAADEALELLRDAPFEVKAEAHAVRAEAAAAYAWAATRTGVDGPAAVLHSAEAVSSLQSAIFYGKDDYATRGRLGWARYLSGDDEGSAEATRTAMAEAPDRIALFHNLALAQVGLGDRAGAEASVEAALAVAAAGETGAHEAELATMDEELGVMARVEPDEAEVLEALQRRVREATIGLRVNGGPHPASDPPQLTNVTAATLHRTEDGSFDAGKELAADGRLVDTGARGVRVVVETEPLEKPSTLSARVWFDDRRAIGYDVDLPLEAGATRHTVDLADPYGRADLPLLAGRYEVELFVDGATRHTVAWTLESAATAEPPFLLDFAGLQDLFTGARIGCGEVATDENGSSVACSGVDNEGITYGAVIYGDDEDRVTGVYLSARREEGDEPVDAFRGYADYVLDRLYTADALPAAAEWVASAEPGERIDLPGSTLEVSLEEGELRLDVTWTQL